MAKPMVRLESIHPVDSRKGFEPYDDKVHEHPGCLDFDAWCRWAARKVGFKIDRRPGTSRMIDGIPHFFPTRYTTGVHCIRVVAVPR